MSASAIGTVVERTTRFTLLALLPGAHGATEVRQTVAAQIVDLPAHLARSLRHGTRARRWPSTPSSAWTPEWRSTSQTRTRPGNEAPTRSNDGLLRQYFPKGTSLKTYSAEDLNEVADELNGRPRKVLGWRTRVDSARGALGTPCGHLAVRFTRR